MVTVSFTHTDPRSGHGPTVKPWRDTKEIDPGSAFHSLLEVTPVKRAGGGGGGLNSETKD